MSKHRKCIWAFGYERSRYSSLVDDFHQEDARPSFHQSGLRRARQHFDAPLGINVHDRQSVLVKDLLQTINCGSLAGIADSLIDGVPIILCEGLPEISKARFHLTHLLRKGLKGNARLRGYGQNNHGLK